MMHWNMGAVACIVTGVLVSAAVGGESAAMPNTSSKVAATRPATSQAAPLEVSKLKFIGLLGDPRFRHADTIHQIIVVAGGKQILTCAADGTARLWDAATGKELRRLQYRDDERDMNVEVQSVALHPDGKRVLTGSYAGMTLWDLESGKVLRTMKSALPVSGYAVSPDGRNAFTAGSEIQNSNGNFQGLFDGFKGTIVQWDVETGRQIREISDQGRASRTLAVSPDSKTLSTVGWDNILRLWEVDTGKALSTLDGRGMVHAVAFSPDGSKLAIASDKTVRLWDLAAVLNAKDGRLLPLWEAELPLVPAQMAFTPDGQTLAVNCNDTVRFLDGKNGQVQRSFGQWGAALAPAFTPHGQTMFLAYGNLVCRWDCATGKRTYPAPTEGDQFAVSPMRALAISPETRRLYSPSGRGICVWNLEDKQLEKTWTLPDYSWIRALQPSLDGRRLLISGSHQAAIFDARTGVAQQHFTTSDYANDPWCWGPEDKTVIIAGDKTPVQLVDVEDGSARALGEVAPRASPQRFPPVLALDRNRRHLVCLALDMSGSPVWSLATGSRLEDLPDAIAAAQWLPPEGAAGALGPSRLLTISHRNVMRYWIREAPAVATPATAEALAGWVKNLSSTDFDLREQATARLIDAGFVVNVEPALAQADVADPEVVDRLARVRRGLDQNAVPDHEVGQPLDFGELVAPLTVHPDGTHWAAVFYRGAASVVVLGEVTPDGPKELRRLSGEEHGPCGLLFSPDGKTLYVGNGNATISIYRGE